MSGWVKTGRGARWFWTVGAFGAGSVLWGVLPLKGDIVPLETKHVIGATATITEATTGLPFSARIEPWSETDTTGFLQTALVDAGRFDPVFDEESLRAIFERTSGNPRQVVRLAELALIAGAAATADRIDTPIIHAAHHEMTWPALEPAY